MPGRTFWSDCGIHRHLTVYHVPFRRGYAFPCPLSFSEPLSSFSATDSSLRISSLLVEENVPVKVPTHGALLTQGVFHSLLCLQMGTVALIWSPPFLIMN